MQRVLAAFRSQDQFGKNETTGCPTSLFGDFDEFFRRAVELGEKGGVGGDGGGVEEGNDDNEKNNKEKQECPVGPGGVHLFGAPEHTKVFCAFCGVECTSTELCTSVDTRHLLDSGNMRSRRVESRSIVQELLAMKFRRSVCEAANALFVEITDGQTFRCKSRQALIWVCIFSALKENGFADYQILQNQMKVRNKKMMQGLKRLAFKRARPAAAAASSASAVPATPPSAPPSAPPSTNPPLPGGSANDATENDETNEDEPARKRPRSYSVSASKISRIVMEKFNATDAQVDEVQTLLRAVRGRSASLSRSRPQSLAAAMVYYWIRSTDQTITVEEFSSRVQLSQATVVRVSDEIGRVLEDVLRERDDDGGDGDGDDDGDVDGDGNDDDGCMFPPVCKETKTEN